MAEKTQIIAYEKCVNFVVLYLGNYPAPNIFYSVFFKDKLKRNQHNKFQNIQQAPVGPKTCSLFPPQ